MRGFLKFVKHRFDYFLPACAVGSFCPSTTEPAIMESFVMFVKRQLPAVFQPTALLTSPCTLLPRLACSLFENSFVREA